MIEIIKSIIDIMMIFIHKLYNLPIEFTSGHYVKLGTVVVAFVSIVFIIYLLLSSLGFIGKDDD